MALKVRDFDASVDFYTRVLGCRPVLRWGEGDKRAVMLDTGDGGCMELFAGGSAQQGDGAVLHFALHCTKVDEVTEAARAAGAEVTVEPKDVDIPSSPPTPVRISFFKGPDGELIELFQNR